MMYEFKELYTLDFRDVKNYTDMHHIIKRELDFPDYYGGNMDAFWDCLTDMRGRPIHIEILGIDVLQQKCGEKAAIMVETLRELKHYNNDKYAHEIKIEIVDGDRRVEIK
jgi:ribonuclease inhibitor